MATHPREPMIRVIAMPADTNPSGDIFGGWLMAQMDLAAGNLAMRVAEGRCVTVAVDGMAFLSPVHVGDEVSFYADLLSKLNAARGFRQRRSR
jgi:acyl-CoA thioesterase YciA